MSAPSFIKKSLGCLTKLLIALCIISVLFTAAIVGLLYIGVQQLKPYCSTEPIAIPDKPVVAETVEALQARVTAFQKAQELGLPQVIALTDTEINTLFAQNKSLKGHLYTRFENNRAYLYLTFPTSSIPFVNLFVPDKYLNAVIDFSPHILKDQIRLDTQRIWVNNVKLPSQAVQTLNNRFEEGLINQGRSTFPALGPILRNLSDMSIREGKLILQTGGAGRVTGR